MGRACVCHAEWPGGAGEVKALLETHEIILRGELRRRLPIAALENVAVDGDRLVLTQAGEGIALTLGAAVAASWARKIAAPPPPLAAKLGIGATTRVQALGTVDDPALREAAAAGIAATGEADADLSIAEVADADTLDRVLAKANAAPLWIAYVKGRASRFGEAAVRKTMRERGWIDVKVASVSDRLTATKFVRR